ncbi:hypothetical protein HN954_03155 [bacterium]|jgi:hypothetical protein|nr:hypothetical protein [bacterium]MBT6832151.1 hypothetical protein [bacterium]MBT6996403.1 hypothetical protein [bacterium]MBT7772138.1 hypothetical protein [bacterium]
MRKVSLFILICVVAFASAQELKIVVQEKAGQEPQIVKIKNPFLNRIYQESEKDPTKQEIVDLLEFYESSDHTPGVFCEYPRVGGGTFYFTDSYPEKHFVFLPKGGNVIVVLVTKAGNFLSSGFSSDFDGNLSDEKTAEILKSWTQDLLFVSRDSRDREEY